MRMEVKTPILRDILVPASVLLQKCHVLSRSIQHASTCRPAATIHTSLNILKIKQWLCPQATEYEPTDLCHGMKCFYEVVSR
jgi:hypothetical protein